MENFFKDSDKVIFLDIDGVLNSALSLYSGQYSHLNKWGIDRNIISAYKKFTEKHNIKTVIISTWRERANGKNSEMEKIILDESGVGIKVDGLTPSLGKKRGFEVEDFVKKYNVKNYVIVDDQDNFFPHQIERFVKTDIALGLTLYDIKKILSILNITDLELKFL
jgi:hypothetical protein